MSIMSWPSFKRLLGLKRSHLESRIRLATSGLPWKTGNSGPDSSVWPMRWSWPRSGGGCSRSSRCGSAASNPRPSTPFSSSSSRSRRQGGGTLEADGSQVTYFLYHLRQILDLDQLFTMVTILEWNLIKVLVNFKISLFLFLTFSFLFRPFS